MSVVARFEVDYAMEGSRKSVHGELVCGICLELMKEPKALSCAHSFCKQCLSRVHRSSCEEPDLQNDLEGINNYCDDDNNSTSKKVECPTCLQITVLPGECSIDSLKTHRAIEDAIASLNPEDKDAIQHKVEIRRKVIADILEGGGNFNADLCKEHEKQQHWFCTDCNLLICIDCIGCAHNLHNCSELGNLLVDSFSQLQSLVQPACEFMSRADTSIKKLIQDSESIESNRNICKEAVLEVFNKLRRAVNEREKKVLDNIDMYIDKKLSHVEQQQKNLIEVQDQLYQSIQEIQQMLDETMLDLSLVMDKQCLIDDVDEQVQNILDLENSVTNSMFSSTYIGFRDDDTQTVSEQLNTLITLCELYPDADTGYYSSRTITFDEEEDYYVEAKSQNNALALCSETRHPSLCTTLFENESVDIFPDFQEELVSDRKRLVSIKRSKSSPNASTKETWLKKMRSSFGSLANDERNVPSIPISHLHQS